MPNIEKLKWSINGFKTIPDELFNRNSIAPEEIMEIKNGISLINNFLYIIKEKITMIEKTAEYGSVSKEMKIKI